LRQSDILTLHAPLSEDNKGIINKENLAKMKPTALLINTARGGLIVEEDLRRALNEGVIAGAAVDVTNVEPLPAESPLMSAKNIIITPHIAYASPASRSRLIDTIVRNIRHVQDGNPSNVIE
jgi:glycerate dehydrogenase